MESFQLRLARFIVEHHYTITGCMSGAVAVVKLVEAFGPGLGWFGERGLQVEA
jgi:hypothetical protein